MPNYLIAETSPRPAPMEFAKVSGNAWPDDYEDDYGLWRHPHAIDADGPIWIYIQMSELPRDARGPHSHKWEADLIAVSAFYACDAAICNALNSAGDYVEEQWSDLNDAQREMAICEVLLQHGVKINLLNKTSTRAKGPFKGCASEARVLFTLWGFYADRPTNQIGESGWDRMRGHNHQYRPATPFQLEVLSWLNRFYPERSTYHNETT